MATTTNFGWETPDDTDLVKDGALAIRTLGSSIDTSLVDLKGGTTGQVLSKASNTDMDFTWVAQDDSNAIQNAIVDAKGDIITATAADTPARLAVGANNTVLTADSSTATGLKWAAASSGAMTLLASGTLSGSSTDITSISGSYKNLQLWVDNYVISSSGLVGFRVNSNTGTVYTFTGVDLEGSDTGGSGTAGVVAGGLQTYVRFSGYGGLTVDCDAHAVINFYNYANSNASKPFDMVASSNNAANIRTNCVIQGGIVKTNTAISSIQIITNAGTWSAGNYALYGVN